MATSKHSDEVLTPSGPRVKNEYKRFKAIHNGEAYYMAPVSKEGFGGY